MLRGINDERDARCANSSQANGTGSLQERWGYRNGKNLGFVIEFFLVHLRTMAILGAVSNLERRKTAESIHEHGSTRRYVQRTNRRGCSNGRTD